MHAYFIGTPSIYFNPIMSEKTDTITASAISNSSLDARVEKIENEMSNFSKRLSNCETLYDDSAKGKRTIDGENKRVLRLQKEVIKYKDKLTQAIKNTENIVYHLMKENEVLRKELSGKSQELEEEVNISISFCRIGTLNEWNHPNQEVSKKRN